MRYGFVKRWRGAAVIAALTLALSAPQAIAGPALGVAPSVKTAPVTATAATGATFYNPVADAFDPTIVTDGGFYYLIGTSSTNSLAIRKSPTIAGLRTATPTVVWTGPATGLGSSTLESPHLEKLQGRWYIYLSVSDSPSSNRLAVYALEGSATDPAAAYTLKGVLRDQPTFVGKGVVGPAVTQMPDGRLYFTSTTFGFYIQEMSDPWTMKAGTSLVTINDGSRTYPWEGGTSEISYPFLKTVGGVTRVFVPYSSENGVEHDTNGGPCWSWCIGMFTNTDGNLATPASWAKSAQPVFAGGQSSGMYRVLALGTFTSPDGTEDWLAYNASDSPGTDFGERDAFVQKFSFNADGTPNFGTPVPLNQAQAVPSGEVGSPPAIAPGTTLVDDSFTSGATAWSPASGTWSACDGSYCSTGSGDSLSLTGDVAWTDYSMQASVIVDSAPLSSGVNIVARAAATNRFYNLELHRDGVGTPTWAIAGNYGGTWQTLKGGNYNWTAGVKYWLRLDVNHGKLTGLISTDGVAFTMLGEVSVLNNSVTTGDYGKVGLRAWGGLTARFDDVKVVSDRATYGFYTGVGWTGLTVDAGDSLEANKWFCVNTYNEYCLGGNVLQSTNAIDTSGATDPLPVSAYQTQRWGDTLTPARDDGSFRYVIPSLVPGTSYQVRLHFAELHYTAAGYRKFDVKINGALVLDEFDAVAAAGAPNKAVVREYTAIADGTGHVTLEFLPGQTPGVDHNPMVNAIQIAPSVVVQPFTRTDEQVTDGTFTHVYNPSIGSVAWYINDHTLIRDSSGTWHMFGITDTEPPHSGGEQTFAHATSPSLSGPWTRQAPALTADPALGENFLWAPHVVKNGSTYYMFYAAGGGPADASATSINLATSTDLVTWTKRAAGPLFRDGNLARDPQVVQEGSRWVMYYTATDVPTGGTNIVAYRTSTDLVNWGPRHTAFTDVTTNGMGPTTESPFVVRHGGYWYLFTGPKGSVDAANNPSATVYRSLDPLHFDVTNRVGHTHAHAPEVVQDTDGSWYITSAGWGEGGLSLAPLSWGSSATTGYTVTAPNYRATIVASPKARLASLDIKTADGGWRSLLEPDGRGTQPYAGVGAWGTTDSAGAAASISVSADGLTVTLMGIPIGGQPITADWTFRLGQTSFDTGLVWHVQGTSATSVRELGLSFDTSASPTTNDSGGTNRSGDVAGFPQWTTASGGGSTVAVAYKTGSAWSTTNRWYGHQYSGESLIAWQSVWSSAGATIPVGTYNGGTWRVGVSQVNNDSALAARLSSGLG